MEPKVDIYKPLVNVLEYLSRIFMRYSFDLTGDDERLILVVNGTLYDGHVQNIEDLGWTFDSQRGVSSFKFVLYKR